MTGGPALEQTSIDKGKVRQRAFVLVAAVALLLAHATVMHYYQRRAELRDVELVLPAQARLALQGHLPGRDFTTSVMPLAATLAGVPMMLGGYTVDIGRLFAALLTALGIGLAAWSLVRRTGRPGLGLCAGFLLVASVYWEALCQRCLPAGAAAAFVGLALVLSTLRLGLLTGAALVGAAIGLAASFEPTALLCLPIGLSLFNKNAPARSRLLAVIALLAVPGALLALQCALFGPGAMWLSAFELSWNASRDMSVFELLVAIWRWSPAPLLVLLIGAFGAVRLVARASIAALGLLVSAIAPFAFELATGLHNGDGAAFAVPLAVVAGIMAMHETGDLVDNPLRWSALLFPLIAFVYPVPPVLVMPAQLQAVREAANALQTNVLSAEPILSSIPAVASSAGRDVVPGTQLGKHSIGDPRSQDALVRRQPSIEKLAALVVSGKVSAVILERGDSPANFSLYFPSDKKVPAKQRNLLRNTVERSYRLVRRFDKWEVYLPKR